MLLYLSPMSLIQVFRMLHLTRKMEISRRCPSMWAYTHSCQFDGYFPKPWLMDLNCWAMNSGVRIWEIGPFALGGTFQTFLKFSAGSCWCLLQEFWKTDIQMLRTVLMEISNKWDTNMNVCLVPATSSSVIAVKLSVLTYFKMIVKC